MSGCERKSHAVLDRDSRILKARKIIRIVGEERFGAARRLLEVGCGSGVISSALHQASTRKLEIHAVDVADNRIDTSGYTFKRVTGTTLPYPSAYFDIVVTNHVVEHVGDWHAQVHHLQEIRRVLSPDGVIYFAVPNKWRLVEPHYRFPFLSWFPQRMSDALLRISRRGTYYDCRPLSSASLRRLFSEADLHPTDATMTALHATLDIERKGHLLTQIVNEILPDGMLALSMPIIPTFVYLLRPKLS
jgi:2-polyprenyl-3-methyl-5-hydroxy-6-metoxy-1,4-benzoquinol methylase